MNQSDDSLDELLGVRERAAGTDGLALIAYSLLCVATEIKRLNATCREIVAVLADKEDR